MVEAKTLNVSPEYKKLLPEVMYNLAKPHADASNGGINILPYDPDVYPGQDPEQYVVRGNPLSRENATNIAELARPGYSRMLSDLQNQEITEPTIEYSKKWMVEEKGSLLVVTGHDTIADIALGLLAVRDLIDIEGVTPRRTSIILAKPLSRMEFVSPKDPETKFPAVPILQMLCDDVFLTIQRSESSESEISRLPEKDADLNNHALFDHFQKEQDEGEYLSGVAATASTKVKRGEDGKLELPAVNSKTAKMLYHPKTLIVALCVGDYDDNLSARFVNVDPESGGAFKANNEDDVNHAMSAIENTVNEIRLG